MSEEIKKEDEITSEEKAETPEEESQTETEDTESEEEEDVEPTESKDEVAEDKDFHKKELERIQSRLGKKVDKEREKRIAAEKAKGLSREEAEALVSEKVSEVIKNLTRSQVEERANKLASSPEEKELILHHYDHSIIPTGNIAEDIENAYTLANKNKVRRQLSEINQTLKSKKSRQGGSDAGTEIKPKQAPKITQEIRDAAKLAGISPEKMAEKLNK